MEQKLKTVPEWISRIREQLSVSYAGLGMKENQTITAIFTWISLKIHARIKNWKAAIRHWKRRRGNSRRVVTGHCGLRACIPLLLVFNKRSKDRNRVHLRRLQLMLDICQKITASIPADAQTEEEIVDSIRTAVCPELESCLE